MNALRSIDFEAINDAARRQLSTLVPKWLPDGKREGAEWSALNPRRADHTRGSFKVNLTTGKWADFATGAKGGDATSLLAYLRGIKQGEAARELANEIGFHTNGSTTNRSNGAAYQAGEWILVSPVPETAPPLSGNRIRTCTPEGYTFKGEIYLYRSSDGQPIFYVARYDHTARRRDKQFKPFSFWNAGNNTEWKCKAVPTPRPLYNLHELTARPTDPVLIVEGEKKAAAAAALFPQRVITTSSNGSESAKKSDWSPMKDRDDIVIWPDADEPGSQYASDVSALVKKAGAGPVRTVNTNGFPESWDLANDLPENMTKDDLCRLVEEAKPDGEEPKTGSQERKKRSGNGKQRKASNGALITEDSAALQFREEHKDDLRYCNNHRSWFEWDGNIWRRNETQIAFRYARELARNLARNEPDRVRYITGKTAFAAGVERFCKSDKPFSVTIGNWDSDPWLLGTPDGTIDLHTGERRPAIPTDFITKSTAVTPTDAADCPMWLDFLQQTTNKDVELILSLS
jgi:5S rRNA maturation endonuclease (ribonuclease M5)